MLFLHGTTGAGVVTPEMASALGGTGLVLFWDQNASAQPGYCADVLLHETAVSWIRHKLTATTPKRPWFESREQYAARLRQAVADINCKFAVGDLCQRFPDRLDELICRQGDRLRS